MDTTTPEPVRIITAGSRHFGRTRPQRAIIRAGLSAAVGRLAATGTWTPGQPLVLVHGACPGTDTTAAHIATSLGWNTEAHPVDWEHEQRTRPATWRRAGPERNHAMAAAGAHLALIFPGGDGTDSCAAAARACGIPVIRLPDAPTTPPITAHSVTIVCDPFAPALAFYTAQLGLPLVDGPRTGPDGRPVAFVDAAGLQLELIGGTATPAPDAPVRQVNFTADDPDALHLTLARRGLTPTKGPWRPDTGQIDQPVLTRYTAPGGTAILIRGPHKGDPPCT